MGRLSEEERRALEIGPFRGPRPGSNFWATVELEDVDGEILDSLIRRGLLNGRPSTEPHTLIREHDHIAECDVDCTHDYDLSAAGRAALKEQTP